MKKRTILWTVTVLLSTSLSASAQEEMYAARRHALLATLDESFAVLVSETAPGRLNKSFYYLTGIKDPGFALVLVPGGEVEEALFSPSGEWTYASQSPAASVHRV
jgi:hypothetical protein